MESAICQFPPSWILLLVVSQERVCSFIAAEWWWRFWVSTGPAPVSPQWEGKGHLLIPGSGLGEINPGFPHGLHWPYRDRCHHRPVRWSLLPWHLPSPEDGAPHDGLAGWKWRIHAWPLLVWVRYSQLFLWCLAGRKQLLPESVLSCQTLTSCFLVLQLEKPSFSWDIIVYTWWYLDCQLFQVQIWSTWSKKKSQGTQYSVVPCMSRSLANLPFSFTFLELCYICFIYSVQGF